MPSWIERRKKFVEEVQELIRKGFTNESIISVLGKKGVARRTAQEYIADAKF